MISGRGSIRQGSPGEGEALSVARRLALELPVPAATPPVPVRPQPLGSGRDVVLIAGEHSDALQVFAPDGRLEVELLLTAEGPVLRLAGARLELSSPGAVALQCRSLTVETQEALELRTRGTLQVQSEGPMALESKDELRLDGSLIRLNSPEEAGECLLSEASSEAPAEASSEAPGCSCVG